jgi:histidyl-tRNA synthetase
MKYTAPRGTRDILPDEAWKWQLVETVFRETAERFGYREIRVPVFEETELFARGIGDSTDVVRKEMYTFADRKGRSLTLRPEGTAGVVRAYVEHNMGRGGHLVKLFYFCPMFRYERPQAGRYRQFWQWGLEAIGSASPGVDAEIIHFSVSFLERLGIKGSEARIGSAGCPACTPGYNEILRAHVGGRIGEFCDDCRERFERNPRRMFDCKNETCKELLRAAPSMLDSLCEECAAHFESVKEHLARMSVTFTVDRALARGLDYYTKTIFEIHHGGLGAQSALAGGGRYDCLVEELGGEPTPASGVSAGVDRLISIFETESALPDGPRGPDVYVATLGESAALESAKVVSLLRARVGVETDHQARSLKSQLREAGRLGVRYAVILGEDEMARGAAILRDMATGEQTECRLEELVAAVTERLGAR